MRERLIRSRYTPWAGLFLGAVGWFFQHQAASETVYWDCKLGGPWLTGGTGLIAALIVISGGVISWTTRHATAEGEERPESRVFAAYVGSGSAGIFLFAILLQTLTGFIVPGCAR